MHLIDSTSIPWIPLGPGESFKPLRFLPQNGGRALLLRLDPGILVPRHRHSGEVHSFTITGCRELDTGEVAGPGAYVYEPPGHVDWWKTIGREPVVVQIIAFGAMEYLGLDGQVLRRDTMSSLRETYLHYCSEQNISPMELI